MEQPPREIGTQNWKQGWNGVSHNRSILPEDNRDRATVEGSWDWETGTETGGTELN